MTDGARRLDVTPRDKCRHFTGIDKGTCKAGVRYADVRAPSGAPLRTFPCLDLGGDDQRTPDTCPAREWMTPEEHAAREAEIRAAIDKAFSAMADGKCHVCGADAEPSRIVGRCKYAACGHRIGQVARDEE